MSSLPLIVLAKLLLMPTVRIRAIVRAILLVVCFIYLVLKFAWFCLIVSFLLAPAGVSFNPLRAIWRLPSRCHKIGTLIIRYLCFAGWKGVSGFDRTGVRFYDRRGWDQGMGYGAKVNERYKDGLARKNS